MRVWLIGTLAIIGCKDLDNIYRASDTGSICIDSDARVIIHMPACYSSACDEVEAGCSVDLAAPSTIAVHAAISLQHDPSPDCEISCEGVYLACELPKDVSPDDISIIYAGVQHPPDRVPCGPDGIP